MNIPRLLPIGYRMDGRPIYPVLGAAPNDEGMTTEPDDEGGDGGDGGDGDGEGGDGKYKPPSRAEWLRTQNALIKANGSAKQRREALAEKDRRIAELEAAAAKREADEERRRLREELTPAAPAEAPGRKGKKAGGGGVPATPAAPTIPENVMTRAQVKQMMAEEAKAAEARAAEKYASKIAGQAARAALKEAGALGNVSRLVQMLDLDEVEIDDDGEVTGGLEDQVEALKAELPQLFAAPEPQKKTAKRTPVTRAGAAGRQDPAPEYKSSAERMAAQIMGSR